MNNQQPNPNWRINLVRNPNASIVVSNDEMILWDATCLEPFNKIATNDPVAQPQALNAFKANIIFAISAEQFFNDTQITVEAARGSKAARWDQNQIALFSQLNENRAMHRLAEISLDEIKTLPLSSAGKTPDDAAAKMLAVFPNGEVRRKVLEIVFACYKSGIYAPIGAITSKDVLNLANMKKFFELDSVSFANKEMIARVFIKLEIGSKDGFSLNHYVKAFYNGVTDEDRFLANTNLLDYYFFQRTDTLGNMYYWVKYAIHYHATIEGIRKGKKSVTTAKMPYKKNSDLKFDRDYRAAVLLEVTDPNYPWDDVTLANAEQVFYFFAVQSSAKSIDHAAESLGRHLRGRMIHIIKGNNLNDKDELKCLQKFVRRMRPKRAFWNGFNTDTRGITVNLSPGLFTAEERIAAQATFGLVFAGPVADQDDEFFDFPDEQAQ